MILFSLRNKTFLFIATMTLFSFPVFAQVDNKTCSAKGYTIMAINGVFTDEKNAIKNKDHLIDILDETYQNETLTVDYLHNPSHLAGVGDGLKALYQKVF